VGKSDSGKSAVLRALRWVCLDLPKGNDFINWESDLAEVTIDVDGHILTRSKGKKNTYKLDNREYTAFGSNIPEDISNVLKVSELNFSKQMDSPYLFNLSPGQVAQELNSIINLSLIDDSLFNIASRLREAGTNEKAVRGRIDVLKAKEGALSWIVEAREKWENIESLSKQKIELVDKFSLLTHLVDNISYQINIIKEKSGLCDDFDLVIKTYTFLLQKDEEIKNIEKLLNSIKETKKLINKTIPIVEINKLENFHKKWDEIVTDLKDVGFIIKRIKETKELIWQNQIRLETVKKELQEQSKGVCPVCNQIIQ
jgi:hypothetical protein